MKVKIYFILGVFILLSVSCSKSDKEDMRFYSVDEELALPANLKEIANDSNNTNPAYDSIVDNLVDGELVSTGIFSVSINESKKSKIEFEIIDLHRFNTNLPDSLDSLVIRAIPVNADILDISNHNYATAFDKGDEISPKVNYTSDTTVLASFLDIGNFKGQSDKYLAFRFKEDLADEEFKYGWFKISCSQNNEILKIHSFAYSDKLGYAISAGLGEN